MAEKAGVQVLYNPRMQRRGGWFDKAQTIVLKPGLRPVEERCTLAHELGHALHRHRSDATGWWKARQEREADQYAARLLITPAAYEAAEKDVGPSVIGIAHALGVTVHLVEVWRDMNERKKQ